MYAKNGVAENWILNLLNRTLEDYRSPQSSGQYADVRVLNGTNTVEIAALPAATFAVSELFPIVETR